MDVQKLARIALRIVVALASCAGIWNSLNLARADFYFKKDTESDIRTAIHFAPDGWPYYMRLAQLNQENARNLLRESLMLNPYDAQADIELGLRLEADGSFPEAEKQLLEADRVDHTYLPRWSLANYYYRRDNMPQFWAWARSATAMPSDDIGALLELCWHASPEPEAITAAILNDKPEFLRQYIKFLIAKDQPRAAALVAPKLMKAGDASSDLPVLLALVNQLVADHDPSDSVSLWHYLGAQQWVSADSNVLNNGDFRREPLPVNFDWSLHEYAGLHSWPGAMGLQTEFSGDEPENCVIAEQTFAVAAGNYEMDYGYHTSGIAPGTGVKWQVLDPKSQTVLAESNDLSSDQSKWSRLDFSVTGNSLLVLRLNYQRTLGTIRVSGTLNVQSVRIRTRQSS